jgi:DNA-binding phage protein
MLSEHILASIGFEEVAKQLGKKPEGIERMLSRDSNPTLKDIAALLSDINNQEGIAFRIEVTHTT